MKVVRRVFVSMPADRWLSSEENGIKWGLVEMVEGAGFFREIFDDPFPRNGLASGKAWSPDGADEVVRRCVGALIIGLPRWIYSVGNRLERHATEYSHYEGALARAIGVPVFLMAEQGLAHRGIFHQSADYVVEIPTGADRNWLNDRGLIVRLERWINELHDRRDFFLGYSTKTEGTAQAIKRFLERDVGATVLDWKTDFPPAGWILGEIEKAAKRCSAGIFLFTRDDDLRGSGNRVAPRDNVVYEAGYFAAFKGKNRALVILEKGAKLPTDLGGYNYISLEDQADIVPIKTEIERFIHLQL
jgi:hypothetical protein